MRPKPRLIGFTVVPPCAFTKPFILDFTLRTALGSGFTWRGSLPETRAGSAFGSGFGDPASSAACLISGDNGAAPGIGLSSTVLLFTTDVGFVSIAALEAGVSTFGLATTSSSFVGVTDLVSGAEDGVSGSDASSGGLANCAVAGASDDFNFAGGISTFGTAGSSASLGVPPPALSTFTFVGDVL